MNETTRASIEERIADLMRTYRDGVERGRFLDGRLPVDHADHYERAWKARQKAEMLQRGLDEEDARSIV